jgi:hypothetical protein
MTGASLILSRLLQLVLALALPIVLGEIGWGLIRWKGPAAFWRVPAVTMPAKLSGALLGVLLLATQYDSRIFDVHLLFGAGGPWDLSFWAFLTDRVNPLPYDYGRLFRPVLSGNFFGWVAVGVIVWAGLTLCFMATAIGFFWKDSSSVGAWVSAVLISLLTAFLTVYFVFLALWTLHLLNFWSFAILIVLFQYYRHRT